MQENMKRRYQELYPNLTIRQIEHEIVLFEKMAKQLGWDDMSANRHKNLRGWLLRADFEKQEESHNKNR